MGDASGGVRFFEARHVRGAFLQIPKYDKDFLLATDASDVDRSTILPQDVNGALCPIAYHRCILTPAELKYSTYDKECLAVLFGCENCRSYLEHKWFFLHCDKRALCWLLVKVKDVGRLGRWILYLAHLSSRSNTFEATTMW